MSKKIIEVPEDATHVSFWVEKTHQGYVKQTKVSDLPDYDEPRTADGLTLKEFVNEINRKHNKQKDFSFIQYKSNHEWCDMHTDYSNMFFVLIEIISSNTLSDHRIKPETDNGGIKEKIGIFLTWIWKFSTDRNS